MGDLIVLGLGGFAGSIFRYLLSGWGQNLAAAFNFPLGTLTVNLLGCFAIGLVSAAIDLRGWFEPQQRLLILTGLLGAFTTFSTFGLETVRLIDQGEAVAGLLNIAANVVLGLLLVIVGRKAFLWLGG
jgi:CrcB protein